MKKCTIISRLTLIVSLATCLSTLQAASAAATTHPAEPVIEQVISLYIVNRTGGSIIFGRPQSFMDEKKIIICSYDDNLARLTTTSEETSMNFSLATVGEKQFSSVTLELPLIVHGQENRNYALCMTIEKNDTGSFAIQAVALPRSITEFVGKTDHKMETLKSIIRIFMRDDFDAEYSQYPLTCEVYTPRPIGTLAAAREASPEAYLVGDHVTAPSDIIPKPELIDALAAQIAMLELTEALSNTDGKAPALRNTQRATAAKQAQSLRVVAGLSKVTPAVTGWFGTYSEEVEIDLTLPVAEPATVAALAPVPADDVVVVAENAD
jgi:hypothetical protein